MFMVLLSVKSVTAHQHKKDIYCHWRFTRWRIRRYENNL